MWFKVCAERLQVSRPTQTRPTSSKHQLAISFRNRNCLPLSSLTGNLNLWLAMETWSYKTSNLEVVAIWIGDSSLQFVTRWQDNPSSSSQTICQSTATSLLKMEVETICSHCTSQRQLPLSVPPPSLSPRQQNYFLQMFRLSARESYNRLTFSSMSSLWDMNERYEYQLPIPARLHRMLR